MRELDFDKRVKIVAMISLMCNIFPFLGIALSLILKNKFILILSVILYFILKLIDKYIWRCPNCNNKLPKGSVENVKFCSNCNFELKLKPRR